jgi:hypothetical protein
MKHLGAVAGGLAWLLATAALCGCSSPSADDEAIAGATKLARGDIERAARFVGYWSTSSADAHANYELARKNLTQRMFVAGMTLLQSHFSESVQTYDVTTTERGGGDNGFGGGYTEKTVRMCARLTSRLSSTSPRVEISNLRCPPGLPDRGIGGPIDKVVPWKPH